MKKILLSLVCFAIVHTIIAQPDITSTKDAFIIVDIDGDGRGDPGDNLRYVIKINNNGTTGATNVQFDDTLNEYLTISSWTSTQGSADISNFPDISWSVGSLSGGGDMAMLTLNLVVDADLAKTLSEICNQGMVSGDNFADVLTDDEFDLTPSIDSTCLDVDPTSAQYIMITSCTTTLSPANGLYTKGGFTAGGCDCYEKDDGSGAGVAHDGINWVYLTSVDCSSSPTITGGDILSNANCDDILESATIVMSNCMFAESPPPPPPLVPTLSQWGLIILALGMLIFGSVFVRQTLLAPSYGD